MARRLRLQIHGQVQGVGFRWHAQRQASALGLSGWVANRSDGTVEAEVEGNDDAVAEFLHWASSGPSNATVERVESVEEAPLHSSGFCIRR